jgi:hypothetical protein
LLVSEIPYIVKQAANMSAAIKPLAEVARGGLVMVGNVSLPAKTLPEVVAREGESRQGEPRVLFGGHAVARDGAAAQPNRGHRHDACRLQGLDPRAAKDLMGGYLPLMFDRHRDVAQATEGRRDQGICGQHADAQLAAAVGADVQGGRVDREVGRA